MKVADVIFLFRWFWNELLQDISEVSGLPQTLTEALFRQAHFLLLVLQVPEGPGLEP